MMMNLFSSFNPITFPSINLNWLSMMIPLILFPWKFWMLNSHYHSLFNIMMNFMFNEMSMILKNKKNLHNSLFFMTLFMMIFLNNISSLFPYIFSSSSHMVFSLSFSLNLFLIYMIFGWSKNFNHMCIHMVPSNSPLILIPFMVIIESISNVIRPLTLAIRLTANIIAGHMLLNLICNNMMNNLINMLFCFLLTAQILLLFLEFNVSLIQSYVFSILSSLYSKESNYD